MRTAEEDELIRRSPCRIKGAGVESSPERPVATLVQVYEIADRIGPRYRALVLVATFGSLRWGELLGLQRIDVDLDARTIRVRRAYQEVAGKLVVGPPKSAAGSRTATIPSLIVPRAAVAPSVLRGGGSGRTPVHRAQGCDASSSQLQPDLAEGDGDVGMPELHFHDPRHTGSTMASAAGASLRELMERPGHSSSPAALIYQHATSERDRAIADALDVLAAEVRGAVRTHDRDDGPPVLDTPTGT